MNEEFAQDVKQGLSSTHKRLSSKYFYDEIGDQIFVKIMGMPEYYLTNSEYEILSLQSDDIRKHFDIEDQEFDLYELGAGDGTKTIELLKRLKGCDFTYKPIDISLHAIETLKERLNNELKWLKFDGRLGEYFKVLNSMEGSKKKIILFLGSNIGNLMDDQSREFIRNLSAVMNAGDKLLLGVDLKKDKEIILPAYDDAQGYSRDFNLNLLRRINKELGADFDLEKFIHQPFYDEEEGIAYSYLESLEEQVVSIKKLNMRFTFGEGERIHTEISRKYDDQVIEGIIHHSGLKIEKVFSDSRNYFSDYLISKA